jgi:hypothetical protein
MTIADTLRVLLRHRLLGRRRRLFASLLDRSASLELARSFEQDQERIAAIRSALRRDAPYDAGRAALRQARAKCQRLKVVRSAGAAVMMLSCVSCAPD